MRKGLLVSILLGSSLLFGCQAIEEATNIMGYNEVEEVEEVQEKEFEYSLNDDPTYITKTIVYNESSFKIDYINVDFEDKYRETTNEVGYFVDIRLNERSLAFNIRADELVEELTFKIADVLLDKLKNDNPDSKYYIQVTVEDCIVGGTYDGTTKKIDDFIIPPFQNK